MVKTEAQIGTAAAKMIESALLSEIKSLGLNLSDDPADRKTKSRVALTPAKKSSAHRRMVRGNPKKLKGIAIHMGKHMFVQEHGANAYRDSNSYTVKGRIYKRKGSRLKISKKHFINNVLKKSGAIPFLADNIGKVRAEEVVTEILKTFNNG